MNSLLRPTIASCALFFASIAFAQTSSGNAPGQNKTDTPANPGNSGNAPGQNKTDAPVTPAPGTNTPASAGNSGQSSNSSNAATNNGNAGASANAGSSTATMGANGANSGGNSAGVGNSGKTNPHDPNPNASPSANAIQAVLQKFDTSRDKIVNDRKALIDQLAAAKNDSERQSVLAQLKAEEQTVQDQQRATAKEIRAELQALRRQRTGQ